MEENTSAPQAAPADDGRAAAAGELLAGYKEGVIRAAHGDQLPPGMSAVREMGLERLQAVLQAAAS